MKFLVPNYSCLQIRGLQPPDPRPLCPLSSTEFVEPPPEKNTWIRHCFTTPTMGRNYKLGGTNKHPHALFFKIHFNIILFIYI